MSRQLMKVLAGLWLGLVLALSVAASARAAGESRLMLAPNEIVRLSMVQNKSIIVEVPGKIRKLVVGNPAIADAIPLSDRTFYLLGRAIGTTNVQVLGESEADAIGILDVSVGVDTDAVDDAIRAAVPEAAVEVSSLNGRLRVTGTVADQLAMKRVLEVAQQFSADPVIDALRVITPQQVSLRVRIIEASRTIGQDLGVQLTGSGSTHLSTDGGIIGVGSAFGDFVSRVVGLGLNVDLAVESLETRGLARNLASPTLVALSGETASFLAGGEVPILVPGDKGTTVQYKEFGVRLSFTPTVLEGGTINIKLEPEVSQVDYANAQQGYPSFSTRRASTTVELAAGQSFVIAGLLQSNRSRQREQVPGLGDLPILGSLFRSSSLKDSETDLIIIVTPELTGPGETAEIEAAADDRQALASGAQFFIAGKDAVSTYSLANALNGDGITGHYGHMIGADTGIRVRE